MSAMTNNRNLQKPFAWLAIFAVLVASLAPPITRAVYKQTIPMPGWVEMCTVEGLKHLPVTLFEDAQSQDSQTSENPDSHSGSPLEHCPFCLTQICSFGLAPVEAVSLPLIAAQSRHFSAHALSAPHARSVWQPNQARAPPAFL